MRLIGAVPDSCRKTVCLFLRGGYTVLLTRRKCGAGSNNARDMMRIVFLNELNKQKYPKELSWLSGRCSIFEQAVIDAYTGVSHPPPPQLTMPLYYLTRSSCSTNSPRNAATPQCCNSYSTASSAYRTKFSKKAGLPFLFIAGLMAGGFVWYMENRKKESEETKVINAVKRQLLNAQRAHKRSDYWKAEESYHNALVLLVDSELAEKQALLEARAITLDKLANLYLEQMKWPESLKYLEFSCATLAKSLKYLEFSSATIAKFFEGSRVLLCHSCQGLEADSWLTPLVTKEHGCSWKEISFTLIGASAKECEKESKLQGTCLKGRSAAPDRFVEAESVFKETMRVMLHAGALKDSDAFIEISLKLGRIYHNLGRYDLAKTAFAWCIGTVREKLAKEECKETRAMLGMSLLCRALFYSYLEEHDKAVVGYSEQLDVAEAVHGKQSIQMAVAYSNLAVAVDACKDSERAICLINRSLEMANALLAQATDSTEVADLKQNVATFHVNLGTIHSNNGKYTLALSAYDQAESLASNFEDEHLLAQIDHGRNRCRSSAAAS